MEDGPRQIQRCVPHQAHAEVCSSPAQNAGQAADYPNRVFSSLYTLDSRFVLSGSDEGNLRIWKSDSSAPLGHSSTREHQRRQYRESLKDKWSHVGEVSKINRQTFLPQEIYAAGKTKKEMLDRLQRKAENRRAHAPKGSETEKPKSERRKNIVRTEE